MLHCCDGRLHILVRGSGRPGAGVARTKLVFRFSSSVGLGKEAFRSFYPQDCRVLGEVRARQLEVDPVLLNSAHSCCARGDQWHRVLSATETRRPGRRALTGNILGNALSQAGFWEAGCSWLSEAQKWQLKPDVVTYSGLFCNWSQSLRLLATMQSAGIRCNVVALTRAVAALSSRRPLLELLGFSLMTWILPWGFAHGSHFSPKLPHTSALGSAGGRWAWQWCRSCGKVACCPTPG